MPIGKVLPILSESIDKIQPQKSYFESLEVIVRRLKAKLKSLDVQYTRIANDHWESFITAFKTVNKVWVILHSGY